ncbi:MAG: adenosylmethionine--8-amino-7-oxononanoate transaminase [Janthinobacterium lividum]
MKHHERLPLIPIARGAGAWLYDTQGGRYLDAISSWWVNLFGHANPRINAALKEQLDTLEHAMLAGCTHVGAVELAERLTALTAHTLGHAFFASDGASAVEIALKMSFHYWSNQGASQKSEFVCVANGYHGETIGALRVTDVPLFRRAYAPMVGAAHVVRSPDTRQVDADNSVAQVTQRALQDVRDLFVERAPFIAALIVEPLVQCAAGFAMHEAAYISGLRQLCDEYGVHLIADEIAVGCGRSGTFFACEQAHIWPDFLCLSKGISGGYLPLSIVLSRDAIYQAFYDDDTARGFLHSHSYTGNPLACRAALAALDIFASDDVLRRNRATAATLSRLASAWTDDARIQHPRQCGMMFAFDARVPAAAASAFSRQMFERAAAAELLLRPIGNTVYWMPPYILDDAELVLLASRTHAVFDAVMRQSEFA